jgi:hypothetical protein
MATTTDEFTHNIAVKLSRAMVALNPAVSLNPNDLLARNVINMAKTNESTEGFMKGEQLVQPTSGCETHSACYLQRQRHSESSRTSSCLSSTMKSEHMLEKRRLVYQLNQCQVLPCMIAMFLNLLLLGPVVCRCQGRCVSFPVTARTCN